MQSKKQTKRKFAQWRKLLSTKALHQLISMDCSLLLPSLSCSNRLIVRYQSSIKKNLCDLFKKSFFPSFNALGTWETEKQPLSSCSTNHQKCALLVTKCILTTILSHIKFASENRYLYLNKSMTFSKVNSC